VTVDPGDEVILTDPTYAGLVNRVRMVGGVPRFVPLVPGDTGWRLDVEGFRAAVSPKTRALLIMNPSLPSGWVATADEWEVIAETSRANDAWLIYVAWWEGMVYDGLPIISPASLPDIRDRLIISGSVSLEHRMIGWRIGWTVGPEAIRSDLSKTQIYNALVPSAILQAGARVALDESPEELGPVVEELQRRRDETLRQLESFPVVPCSGGWSVLMDTAAMGIDCAEASKRMLDQKVAATQMGGWGAEVADRYLRFVFSREPLDRLALLGDRARAALGASIE
jgi:aspartate/methionine/tyrosine aminotransferase